MKKTTKAVRVPVAYLGTVVAMAMILAVPSLAGAGVVFQYDYNNQAGAGEDPCNPPWDYLLDPGPNDPNDPRDIEVLTDTGNLFGGGTGNKYYRHVDNMDGGGGIASQASNQFSTTVATYSLEFIDQPAGPGTPSFSFGQIVAGGTTPFGSNRVNSVSFENGTLAGVPNAYTVGQKHHLDVIINTSNSTVNYGTGQSVDPNTFDAWIDGVLKVDNAARENRPTNVIMGGVSFQSGNTSVHGDFLVDHVTIRDEPFVIPEPTTLILLVIGLLTAAAVCGRRK